MTDSSDSTENRETLKSIGSYFGSHEEYIGILRLRYEISNESMPVQGTRLTTCGIEDHLFSYSLIHQVLFSWADAPEMS